jgi:hypothetical protein
MSSAPKHAPRRDLDAYYTPPELAHALVGLLPIRPGALAWEPHAGGGAFVGALLRAGAVVTASDVNPDAPGLRLAQASFVGDFTRYLCRPGDPVVEWIVGNPPFRGFEQHVEHALTWAPNVAFLLRLAVMESAGRADFWRRWPLRRVWVLAERPSFTGTGTDSAAYGWFHFERGYTGDAAVAPGWSWKRAGRAAA